MPDLFRIEFNKNSCRFELSISWNDAAFSEEGIVSFDITASARDSKNPDWDGSLSLSVSINPAEKDEPMLNVTLGGKPIASVPLKPLLEHSLVIDRIPAAVFGLNPVTGCLIRSGLSAIISQIIECKSETAGVDWYWARTKAIAHCIRDHIPELSLRAAFLSARCVVRAGF
jgi:hypothetical protein